MIASRGTLCRLLSHPFNTMTSPSSAGTDVVDQLVGLTPDMPLHAVRHQRDQVVHATQGSYDALLSPDVEGLSVQERWLVGWYAARLTPCPALAQHYQSQLDGSWAASVRTAVEQDQLSQVQDARLRAVLEFVRALITKPITGDKALLHTLPAAGLSTPAVVALAQWIAFLSYQARLVTGLQALKRWRAQ
jgi:uncharacterized protein YciW